MSKLEDNLAKAEGFLERFRTTGVQNQIAGEAVPSSIGRNFRIHLSRRSQADLPGSPKLKRGR